MRINRNNIEVAPCGAPLFKCDAWQLGSGALGAIGSLVGGAVGSRAQLKAVRETNETNKQIADSNNQWNYRMFNEQNEYNSAIQQRSRLEQAGMNPYLMMNGGSAGVAQNAPTADESGKAVAPDIGNTISSSIQNASNIVADSVLKSAQSDQIQADTRKKQAEADIAESKALFQQRISSFELANMQKQGVLTTEQIRHMQLANKYDDETMLSRIRQQSLESLQAAYRANLIDSQDFAQRVENKFAERKQAKEFEILCQEYLNAVADGKLTLQQARTSASQQILNYALARKSDSDTQYQNIINSIFGQPIVQKSMKFGLIGENNEKVHRGNLARKQDENYDTDKYFNRAGAVLNGVETTYGMYQDARPVVNETTSTTIKGKHGSTTRTRNVRGRGKFRLK